MKPVTLTSLHAVQQNIAEVLERWPLYREFSYNGYVIDDVTRDAVGGTPLPKTVTMFCPICKKGQTYELKDATAPFYTFQQAMYVCRNCKDSFVRFALQWKQASQPEETSSILKFGQFPPFEEEIFPELRRRLSEPDHTDLDYFRKAIRCRNFGYGLAALSYLRRVVENRMNDLLDLIVDLAQAESSAPLAEQVEAIKESKSFSDKVDIGARILPDSLKPSGHNPFDLLHDLASEGIHSRSEDESLELFDGCRSVFEYLFRELEVRKEDAHKYLEGMKKLAEKKAARASREHN